MDQSCVQLEKSKSALLSISEEETDSIFIYPTVGGFLIFFYNYSSKESNKK